MASFRTNATAAPASGSTDHRVGDGVGDGAVSVRLLARPVSYTNNYQVWAGTCRQEQPPAGNDMFTVTPGSSLTNQTIQEPALHLQPQAFNGTP